MKKIVILGSTGSIGTQTLEVIRENPRDFRVLALTGYKNQELLNQQLAEFKAITGNPSQLATFKEADLIVNAISGTAGIEPTYKAVKAGKDIALANKESLVSAGTIIMNLARKTKSKIIPIDSEHSAIFQILQHREPKEIDKIILTCSGGPFHGRKSLKNITKKQALNHPTWSMGPKITIDSATLMNKGLEVIEAKHLFSVSSDKIDVIIHPQSIIHGMVKFSDGSVIALLGEKDMKIPIKYALYYPEIPPPAKSINLAGLNLTFCAPDLKTFRLLALAKEIADNTDSTPAYMNAANDQAVNAFLRDEITFDQISKIVERKTREHKAIKNPKIEDILALNMR